MAGDVLTWGRARALATRLLAERVGDTGSVLAVDLDVRLLEPLAGDRVEVRRHDLLSEPLPEAVFVVVHARNLLMHPGRLDALRRLLAAVRPGGWLAVCEPDFNALTVSPPSAAWYRAWSLFCDTTVAGGWDPGYGSRLLGDLEALDLADLEGEVVTHYVRGGSVRRGCSPVRSSVWERGWLSWPPRIRTSRPRNDCCAIRA